EVKSTSGDTQLGGTDMDEVLVDYIAEEFKKENSIDLKQDKTAFQRLKEAAEKAKIELSSTLETDINLPFISANDSGPKHLTMKITQAKLEELVKPIVEKCKGPMDQAMKDAKLTSSDITKIIMVGGPTRMPIVRKFVEDYTGKKIEGGVNPMECVAMGAAIQGGILTGETKDILLLDVTPLTLGIETLGQVMTPLIERNTTIPASKTQIFSTAADNQPGVDIHILQGERPMSADNRTLGRFMLDGIPPAPRGVPQIEVTFDIDANGILNVSAKDKGTGKEQKITITDSSALSKEEIDKMQKEAETHATEDRKQKELIETRNQADTLIFSTEKALKEAGDKVKEEDKKEVDQKLEVLKKVKDSNKIEELKKAIDELSQIIQKIGAQLYQKVEEEKAEQSEPEIKGKAEPVEGEFEEVKKEEEKK
ncbi:Hsp70 family protein, partial [Patescibacteria group bacterium]|nr:Hsp70 family protein [Patescibacteria group bacterium]